LNLIILQAQNPGLWFVLYLSISLSFIGLDGFLRHLLRQQLFADRKSHDVLIRDSFFVIILFVLEVLGVFAFATGAVHFVISEPHNIDSGLFGWFCGMSALFNLVCYMVVEDELRRQNQKGTGSARGPRTYSLLIWIWRILPPFLFLRYLRMVFIRDARETPELQSTNLSKLWIPTLREVESYIPALTNARCGVRFVLRVLIHLSLQFSVFHAVLFNLTFAAFLLQYSFTQFFNLPLRLGYIAKFLDLLVSGAKLIVSSIDSNLSYPIPILLFVLIVCYGITSYCEIFFGEEQEGRRWTKSWVVERCSQIMGNIFIYLSLLTIIVTFLETQVKVAIASQCLAMVLQIIGSIVRFRILINNEITKAAQGSVAVQN